MSLQCGCERGLIHIFSIACAVVKPSRMAGTFFHPFNEAFTRWLQLLAKNTNAQDGCQFPCVQVCRGTA